MRRNGIRCLTGLLAREGSYAIIYSCHSDYIARTKKPPPTRPGCPMKKVRFGELFCGPGGMSLGALLAARDEGVPIEHRWALDYDQAATATFQHNFPRTRVITADIREFALEQLERVHGMAFGFPCNDYSIVGERKGFNGSFGPLYQYCVEAVSTLQPDWFVAENVGGLRSANKGEALLRILTEFEDLGYRLTPHMYKLEEYGVPQHRHRIIVVGLADRLGLRFEVPSPLTTRVSARVAIEHPPIPDGAPNHEMTRQSKAVIARLRAIGPGENAFNARLPRALRLNVRGATISQIYRRLDPDKPSYTVTGSGGGGTHVYHWSEPRALTNRERARLQTFPDDYVFEGGKEAVRRQIGMAVPPQGARAVFRALFKCLNGRSYHASIPSLGGKYDRQESLL